MNMDLSSTTTWDTRVKSVSSPERSCHSSLKLFLASLSFAYFTKALSGSYMKSTITQLERRFDIPSYLIGIIDGSFEMGNLLVIAFVSYFGAKFHRPKIIAVGCLLMSLGTFLIAMPHFITDRYKIDTSIQTALNSSSSLVPCPVRTLRESSRGDEGSSVLLTKGCQQESSVSMWIYVLLGNVLRGIGETPVQPLGISYIDDYAQSENAALYIGCIQTLAVIGPVFGYLLGSVCAKVYVDVGLVDLETLTITPSDSRWVGAWWLGYLVAGVITLMSAVPFWFLPKSLPIPLDKSERGYVPEHCKFISEPLKKDYKVRQEEPASFHLMANEFLPTLKTLFGNPVYVIYLCVTVIQFNSLIGMVTYKPKYIEQHYVQSASKANFLMGMVNIPAVALGMFSGGVLMKRYKVGIMGAAKFAFGTSFLGYFLSLFFLAMGCENTKVAGVTVPYSGLKDFSLQEPSLFADCNSNCSCSSKEWDPVCGENGITYVSPCLAGCTSSSGSGRSTVFHNCKCVGLFPIQSGNMSATLGKCPHRRGCDRVFPYFLALSVITSFIISLGGTPGFMLLVRCIKPELKALALGIHTLATRTLAGIPAPIYFGAFIDMTCLKWGHKVCGGKGACRIYDTTAYRLVYLGLTLGLRTVSFFLCAWAFVLLKRHLRDEGKTLQSSGSAELELLSKEENGSVHGEPFVLTADCNGMRETDL